MVPRTDMLTVDADREDARRDARSSSTRASHGCPSSTTTPTTSPAVLYLKDLVQFAYRDDTAWRDAPISRISRRAVFVPESMKAETLLQQMKRESVHVCPRRRRVRRRLRTRHPRGSDRGARGRDRRRVRPTRPTRSLELDRRPVPGQRAPRPRRCRRSVRPRARRRRSRLLRRPARQGPRAGAPTRGHPSSMRAWCSPEAPPAVRGLADSRTVFVQTQYRNRRKGRRMSQDQQETPRSGFVDVRRAAQRRQVDADECPRRREGRHHQRQAADHAPRHPRDPPTGRPASWLIVDTPGIHKPPDAAGPAAERSRRQCPRRRRRDRILRAGDREGRAGRSPHRRIRWTATRAPRRSRS